MGPWSPSWTAFCLLCQRDALRETARLYIAALGEPLIKTEQFLGYMMHNTPDITGKE